MIASPGAPPVPPAESAWGAGLTPRQIADRVAAPFLARDEIRTNYTNDLTLISLLAMYDATGDDGYLGAVRNLMRDRGQPPGFVHPFKSQPFCSVSLELYLRTKDSRYVKPFLDETAKYRAEAPRSYDGAVSHYGDPAMGRILIDQIQDYTSRMAHAGTIGGDGTFHREAVGQWRLFRDALRNPETGLWAHARGWFEDPMEIVPTAWGRGQGWLLRGLVETRAALPDGSVESRQLQAWLEEFAASLVPHQDESGMWHQIVDRPESFPETSATALICYNYARAVHLGYLPAARYRTPAIRACDGLMKGYVTADGAVHGTCQGTGPQRTVEDYLSRATPVNDQHGIAAVIFACAGRLLLDR